MSDWWISVLDPYTGERVLMSRSAFDRMKREAEFRRMTVKQLHEERIQHKIERKLPLAIVVQSSSFVTTWHFVVRSLLTAARWMRRTTSSIRRDGADRR